MHWQSHTRLAALAFLALALAGCGTAPTSPSTSPTRAAELAVTTTLVADPTLVADDLTDASAQASVFGLRSAGSSTSAPRSP